MPRKKKLTDKTSLVPSSMTDSQLDELVGALQAGRLEDELPPELKQRLDVLLWIDSQQRKEYSGTAVNKLVQAKYKVKESQAYRLMRFAANIVGQQATVDRHALRSYWTDRLERLIEKAVEKDKFMSAARMVGQIIDLNGLKLTADDEQVLRDVQPHLYTMGHQPEIIGEDVKVYSRDEIDEYYKRLQPKKTAQALRKMAKVIESEEV